MTLGLSQLVNTSSKQPSKLDVWNRKQRSNMMSKNWNWRMLSEAGLAMLPRPLYLQSRGIFCPNPSTYIPLQSHCHWSNPFRTLWNNLPPPVALLERIMTMTKPNMSAGGEVRCSSLMMRSRVVWMWSVSEGRGASGVRIHFWTPAEDIDICESFSRWGFVLEEI